MELFSLLRCQGGPCTWEPYSEEKAVPDPSPEKNSRIRYKFRPHGSQTAFLQSLCFQAAYLGRQEKLFSPKKTHVLRQGRGATTYITANVVEGPPGDIDWNQPWHTILHAWHRRIDQQLDGFKMWSTKYLSEYWKFANYVALLDDNRWVKRILHWNPGGEGLDAHFSMATSTTKFLPLASLGHLT